jgi:glutamine---fructose-6-phosphate transaminase (isomerizing)
MYDMIKETPGSFDAALKQAAALDFPRRKGIVFTGSGTAFYSAWLGSQILAGQGVSYSFTSSFEMERYEPVTKDDMVVGVSHSGITKTTVDSLRMAKASGAYTIGLTHFENRPIHEACDLTAVIGTGPDKSRCHTKTYVDSAGAVARIGLAHAKALGRETEELERKLQGLGQAMEGITRASESWAKGLVDRIQVPRQIVFVGGGPNLVTAREAALKIKEASFLPAEGIELEEEMHGPWNNLGSDSMLVVIAPTGKSTARAEDLVRAASKIKVPTVVVGDKDLASDSGFVLPEVDEGLTPYLAILPLYFLAYFLSVKLGHNPDYLRYLEPAYWDARTDIFPPGTH